jgi:hypothetical protein
LMLNVMKRLSGGIKAMKLNERRCREGLTGINKGVRCSILQKIFRLDV